MARRIGNETISLEQVLGEPRRVAELLIAAGDVYGLVGIEVRVADRRMVVFWLTLDPWKPMAKVGYPTEHVSITVWPSGRIVAVPVDARSRSWEHRNAFVLGSMSYLGELCLWFPSDPASLRWKWADGFAAYITVVHRHLQAEEYFRRNRRWPAEDAPHGSGNHPIRTVALRRIAAQGAA